MYGNEEPLCDRPLSGPVSRVPSIYRPSDRISLAATAVIQVQANDFLTQNCTGTGPMCGCTSDAAKFLIGLDTNVLLRLLVKDDIRQMETAARAVAQRCTAESPGYVNQIVLCEVVWVLQAALK